jgi:hypothetical protein
VYVKGIKLLPQHANKASLPRPVLHLYLKSKGFKDAFIAQAADIYIMPTKTFGIRFASVDLAKDFMDGKHQFLRGLPVSAYYALSSANTTYVSRQAEADAELASLVEAYEASLASGASASTYPNPLGNGSSRSPPHHGPSPRKKKPNVGPKPSLATPMEEEAPAQHQDLAPRAPASPPATAMEGVTEVQPALTPAPSGPQSIVLGQDEMDQA